MFGYCLDTDEDLVRVERVFREAGGAPGLDPSRYPVAATSVGFYDAEYSAIAACLSLRPVNVPEMMVSHGARGWLEKHPAIGAQATHFTDDEKSGFLNAAMAAWNHHRSTGTAPDDTVTAPEGSVHEDEVEEDILARPDIRQLLEAAGLNPDVMPTADETARIRRMVVAGWAPAPQMPAAPLMGVQNPPPQRQAPRPNLPRANATLRAGADSVLARMLGSALNPNGQLSVGLAASTDLSLGESFRVPVPANVTMATNPGDLLRIAHWSKLKYEARAPTMSEFSDFIYTIWLVGWVRTIGVPPSIATIRPDMTAADRAMIIREMNWDTEVVVLAEDVPGLGVDLSDNELVTFKVSAERAPFVQKYISLIVAAKITFRVSNHHLGARVKSASGAETWSGYTAKVAKNVEINGLGYGSDPARDALHKLVHPASTIAVLTDLYSEHAADFKVTVVFPGAVDAAADGQPVWRPVPVQALSFASDVVLRLPTLGAGYAKLGDTVAGFARLLTSAIFPLAPYLDQLSPMLDEYKAVREHPIRYGIASAYLCRPGVTVAERTNSAMYEGLYSAVGAYVGIVLKGTTLNAAACFSKNPIEYEVVDDNWIRLLRQYRLAISATGVDQAAALKTVLGVGSLGGVTPVPDVVLNKIVENGLPNVADRYRVMVEKLNENVRAAPNEPEGIVEEMED